LRGFYRRTPVARVFGAVVFFATLLLAGGTARAQNLVTNGNFSSFSTTVTQSFQFGTYGPYTPSATLTGWASAGYN